MNKLSSQKETKELNKKIKERDNIYKYKKRKLRKKINNNTKAAIHKQINKKALKVLMIMEMDIEMNNLFAKIPTYIKKPAAKDFHIAWNNAQNKSIKEECDVLLRARINNQPTVKLPANCWNKGLFNQLFNNEKMRPSKRLPHQFHYDWSFSLHQKYIILNLPKGLNLFAATPTIKLKKRRLTKRQRQIQHNNKQTQIQQISVDTKQTKKRKHSIIITNQNKKRKSNDEEDNKKITNGKRERKRKISPRKGQRQRKRFKRDNQQKEYKQEIKKMEDNEVLIPITLKCRKINRKGKNERKKRKEQNFKKQRKNKRKTKRKKTRKK